MSVFVLMAISDFPFPSRLSFLFVDEVGVARGPPSLGCLFTPVVSVITIIIVGF